MKSVDDYIDDATHAALFAAGLSAENCPDTADAINDALRPILSAVVTDDDEDDPAAEHEAEQARITAEWEARAAPYTPRPVTNPKRFYVSLTWDDWPDGGSYSTVIEADNDDDAEHAARWEMANQREEFDHPADCIESYGDQWHLVACWDLDDFLASHAKTET